MVLGEKNIGRYMLHAGFISSIVTGYSCSCDLAKMYGAVSNMICKDGSGGEICRLATMLRELLAKNIFRKS